MPNINDFEPVPRKDLHVFYILDTSGSMEGEKISRLNHAMEETVAALQDVAEKNADARIKIAVMEFNSGCKWITSNGPEDLEEDFEYEYLSAGGLTDIGAALTELDSKLHRDAFLKSAAGALMPIIIFMTDGNATDNYKDPLEEIRKNKWFHRGTKIGFAIGEDADTAMIASVVGNVEAVIQTSDLVVFSRLLKFVSVSASMLQSKSHTTADSIDGASVVEEVIKKESLPDNLTPNLNSDDYDPEPTDSEFIDIDDEW